MYFIDTETAGLHGVPVLLQYAKDDGPIELYSLWKRPAGETIDLLDKIAAEGVVGYNLTFDWFHLTKFRCMLSMVPTDLVPYGNIPLMASVEADARDAGCFKAATACDLLLVGQKTKYQALMKRKPITIRWVPQVLASALAEELGKRVELPDIFFTKGAKDWRLVETDKPGFVHLELKTSASLSLKAVAKYILGREGVTKFSDVEVPKSYMVDDKDFGYAPFHSAIKRADPERITWPQVLWYHIHHWDTNEDARAYASDDITNTRLLYKHFGSPELGDDDSVLACMVGAVRWRGFTISRTKLRALKAEAKETMLVAPRKPSAVKEYLYEVLDEFERTLLDQGTGKLVLEALTKWEDHPVCERANKVIKARGAVKRIEVIDKLLLAGRLHASFRVIGAKSARMSGADGLNAQGIAHEFTFRDCFDLAHANEELWGGDFDSFEVALACAAYPDTRLIEMLKSGKKIHALMGMAIYGGTYEDIMATKELKGSANKYHGGKTGTFLTVYGGDYGTMMRKLGIPEETAVAAIENFNREYPGLNAGRLKTIQPFQAMHQPKGIGTRISWKDPADYVESLFGFRRDFSIENKVMKALYDLSNSMPKEWAKFRSIVIRRDREQTAVGAASSALYGAAFGLQGQIERAAGNHRIQSSGAQITKRCQCAIWEIQPVGFGHWLVQNMNIHDEIMSSTHPSVAEQVKVKIDSCVKSYEDRVPLISFQWKKLKTWAGK